MLTALAPFRRLSWVVHSAFVVLCVANMAAVRAGCEVSGGLAACGLIYASAGGFEDCRLCTLLACGGCGVQLGCVSVH